MSRMWLPNHVQEKDQTSYRFRRKMNHNFLILPFQNKCENTTLLDTSIFCVISVVLELNSEHYQGL